MPFLAASNSAALPLNKSATSLSLSLTSSKGVCPSRFFFVSSAPCLIYFKQILSNFS